jgi:hypothetical protein
MEQENFDKSSLEGLTNIFRQAGALDPESWASSQHNEGINQLGRFSFLKNITSEWLREDDLDWVNNCIKYDYSNPNDPCSQLPRALQEMLDKNVSRQAIVDLIRLIQFETLFHVCSTIDGTYETDTPVKDWTLYQLDNDGKPVDIISGLHESLLEFDPSGNEMRPRKQDASR